MVVSITRICSMFAVVPVPIGDMYTEYYILDNGSDTADCGGSVDSGCASLLHVLKLYYAEPPTKGLKITTDKSLQINNNLMVIVVCLTSKPT